MTAIKTQQEFNECLLWVSDFYKDVYGCRPRGYNFEKWSFQELTDFVNDLGDVQKEQASEELEYDNQAIGSVMSLGVDKLTALKWLDDADKHYMFNDDEFYSLDIDKYGWVAKYSPVKN
tara:strand:+ start:42 stop:398 length:357 start_codon:yes stop_codon:yes gene_type:complete